MTRAIAWTVAVAGVFAVVLLVTQSPAATPAPGPSPMLNPQPVPGTDWKATP